MIKKSEFIIGLVIMFVLFMLVNGIIVSDINDTTVITKTKTEYIEKVSLSGRMQDYSDETETTITIETDNTLLKFDANYVKIQCNGKFVADEDGDESVCAGDWVITAKEVLE